MVGLFVGGSLALLLEHFSDLELKQSSPVFFPRKYSQRKENHWENIFKEKLYAKSISVMLTTVVRKFKPRSPLVDSLQSRSFSTTVLSPSPSTALSTESLSGTAVEIDGEDTTASSTVTPTMPNILQPRVVVYDGVCPLCHGGVKWVIQTDKYRKIKFCCLQSLAAEPYLRACGLTREDVMKRFIFVEGLGLYHQGSTAALRVLSYLPLPYSALGALTVVPRPLRDGVYDYVASRRYNWFGKAEDCLVLKDKELLDRFIDREELMDRM